MKLFGSLTSPYVRKLRVIASELALPVTLYESAALEDPADLIADLDAGFARLRAAA
jgi:glutathione S-transferase